VGQWFSRVFHCLVAFLVVGHLNAVERVGVGLFAAPAAALALTECAFAIRPTQRRLARADRLALITVGTFFALGLIGLIAMTIQ